MEAETHQTLDSSPPSKKPKPSPHSSSSSSSSSSAAAPPDSSPSSAAAALPDSAAAPAPAAQRRYKRRKVAILLGYCGYGYQGMQKNPGAKTIEGDFEEALFRAGAVPEADKNSPRRFDWARAARTDKGVSAAAQVVSGRFTVDPPGFIERLNEQLADQIHVFGYKRVTGAFNAKKFCDRRRYVYLLPVFALDMSAHRDREAVMRDLGLVKCVECSERGRKVPKEGNCDDFCGNGSEIGGNNCEGTTGGDGMKVESRESNGELGSNSEERSDVNETGNNGSVFCYGEEEKERFNKILKSYVGTHNFHNFTTRTKAEDPAAKRYIISFNANSVVTLDGIEFVKCEVIGQSFMLHQIRKMVGLAVAIMRNCAPESLMEVAFRKDVRINVPTAPEVGLFLDECMFSSYNKKWNKSHEEVSMKDYEQQAEEFKIKYIYSHIASMEHKEGAVALWLHSLNKRNYPDFGYLEKNGGNLKEEKNGEDLKKEEMEEVKEVKKEEMEEVKKEEMEELKKAEMEVEELKEVKKEEMEELKKEEMEEMKKEEMEMEEVKKEEIEELKEEEMEELKEEMEEEKLGKGELKEVQGE